MKQWKRILFSVISLVWGFVSLDYLIYAFEMLTGSRRSNVAYSPKADGIYQLLGFGMFFALVYHTCILFYLIRKASIQIDLVEEKRWKRNCTSQRSLTGSYRAVFFTGILIRWCYLIFFLSAGIKIEKIRKTNRKNIYSGIGKKQTKKGLRNKTERENKKHRTIGVR